MGISGQAFGGIARCLLRWPRREQMALGEDYRVAETLWQWQNEP